MYVQEELIGSVVVQISSGIGGATDVAFWER
jgi:hypothetical protein